MNLKEWREYEANRQKIISQNRSRRLSAKTRGLPPLEVPPKLPRPKVPQLYDRAGYFIGTFKNMTEAEAIAAAEAEGYKVGKVKWVDEI